MKRVPSSCNVWDEEDAGSYHGSALCESIGCTKGGGRHGHGCEVEN